MRAHSPPPVDFASCVVATCADVTRLMSRVSEAGLIYAVPDDNTALVVLQALTGVAAGAGAVTLFGASALFSVLQGKD